MNSPQPYIFYSALFLSVYGMHIKMNRFVRKLVDNFYLIFMVLYVNKNVIHKLVNPCFFYIKKQLYQLITGFRMNLGHSSQKLRLLVLVRVQHS